MMHRNTTPLTPEEEAAREALDSLVNSPGWRMLLTQYADEWEGEPFTSRIEALVTSTDTDDTAKEKITALIAARRHVRAMLTWPQLRLMALHSRGESAAEAATRWSRPR